MSDKSQTEGYYDAIRHSKNEPTRELDRMKRSEAVLMVLDQGNGHYSYGVKIGDNLVIQGLFNGQLAVDIVDSWNASIPVKTSQIARLMAERDLLLSAIAPEDYMKIKAQLVAISEKPDSELK